MVSQTGQQIVEIHILLNISRNKGNQRMTFGQLLDYNKKTIFLEKSYTKCGAKTSPRPFYKKSIISLWINILKYYRVLCMSKSRSTKIYENLGADHLLLLYIKLSYKTKIGLQPVSLPHFLHDI